MLSKTKPPSTWSGNVALGRPYRQTGVLTFHFSRQRSLHFMVVASWRLTMRGNKDERYTLYREWMKHLRKDGREKERRNKGKNRVSKREKKKTQSSGRSSKLKNIYCCFESENLLVLQEPRKLSRYSKQVTDWMIRNTNLCRQGYVFAWTIPAAYTGCNRRNVREFGRVFLMSNYTDITQNTYIQS